MVYLIDCDQSFGDFTPEKGGFDTSTHADFTCVWTSTGKFINKKQILNKYRSALHSANCKQRLNPNREDLLNKNGQEWHVGPGLPTHVTDSKHSQFKDQRPEFTMTMSLFDASWLRTTDYPRLRMTYCGEKHHFLRIAAYPYPLKYSIVGQTPSDGKQTSSTMVWSLHQGPSTMPLVPSSSSRLPPRLAKLYNAILDADAVEEHIQDWWWIFQFWIWHPIRIQGLFNDVSRVQS